MPLFNEQPDADRTSKPHHYVYSLEDCFQRGIPVTSIEFNPGPVSTLEKQELKYWRELNEPDEEDLKIIRGLKSKYKSLLRCREVDAFQSITDSAAGILRMHNLTLMTLLSDPEFTSRWLQQPPLVWEPRRTIIHLTRNHSVKWVKEFLDRIHHLGFNQLLIITGDPLKEVRYKPVTADEAFDLNEEGVAQFRLKNSVELLRFVTRYKPDMYVGVGHNPFLKKEVAEKHLLRKLEAGSQFIITQPVAYYDECWQFMDLFDFCRRSEVDIPVILGVFNYAAPCNHLGVVEEGFQKRHKMWKKLFGFVPQGVRVDYDRGLNGIEILARSINQLKRKGYFHFDVMNAERSGARVLRNRQRLTHESDRIAGVFDQGRAG